ncbi:hypothetical protein RM572_07765 [Streptomyces sp. DSM 42041]|uniref:Uncharacterized protein n=1 Tax=Streptomyces hazeniae TaxID=3075538 RepID=A0ABU2NNX0_9ACTN|nr:hypothetical protein [Streptomyces sp. DSM 42041]MDT0378675.1 hypothetical protein [Streptomyces sp. DSM 42041]
MLAQDYDPYADAHLLRAADLRRRAEAERRADAARAARRERRLGDEAEGRVRRLRDRFVHAA